MAASDATGYDIAIPGNHEFDYGMENFLELTGKAEFPYISCNFNKEGELVFPPYVIREFDDVKIGFVGVTTPMTIRDSAPKYFMDENGSWQGGSGIRADIGRGSITMNDIMKALPYGTKLDLVEVTGRQVLDILEWSVHAMPAEFGGFEHVAGLTYEVDPDTETPCVENAEKMLVSIDETMPRRVSNVKVGDGFTMFRQASVLQESDAADSEALLAYITGPLGGVIGEEYTDPYGQGRMVSR